MIVRLVVILETAVVILPSANYFRQRQESEFELAVTRKDCGGGGGDHAWDTAVDSDVVSGHKSSQGRGGSDLEFSGYENLRAVQLRGD